LDDLFAIASWAGYKSSRLRAVAGEIALHDPLNKGTLIVGDASINLEPYGFNFSAQEILPGPEKGASFAA
jgi:hypothetical protein